jgi:mono/diheme cytochrome c family protein
VFARLIEHWFLWTPTGRSQIASGWDKLNRTGGILFGLLAFGPTAYPEPPTWAGDVAKVIYANCVECHRPNESAPFSLLTYVAVAKRAKTIVSVVGSHLMPPWQPVGERGVFEHDRRLTEAEIKLISDWYAAGSPSGDLHAAPPAPPAPAGGWRLGPPDLIVRMPAPFPIPAGPGDVYRAFPIPFSLAGVPPHVLAQARIGTDPWLAVRGIEIHPGNKIAEHHAHVWADTSGIARHLEREQGGYGFTNFGSPGFPPAAYLGGRVAGTVPRFLPAGIATVMPLSGEIVLQIHYAATGKPEFDQTEVGIYFARGPVTRLIDSFRLGSFNIEIPPGAEHYRINDTQVIPVDTFVLSISPHMHLLGREVHARAILPDGQRITLIDIMNWRFVWQDRYYFKEPIFLPKGTRVSCEWIYDNTASNPQQPSLPPQHVSFGPNSTDEMCELHLGVIPVSLADTEAFVDQREQMLREKVAELSPQQRARYQWEEGFEQ